MICRAANSRPSTRIRLSTALHLGRRYDLASPLRRVRGRRSAVSSELQRQCPRLACPGEETITRMECAPRADTERHAALQLRLLPLLPLGSAEPTALGERVERPSSDPSKLAALSLALAALHVVGRWLPNHASSSSREGMQTHLASSWRRREFFSECIGRMCGPIDATTLD